MPALRAAALIVLILAQLDQPSNVAEVQDLLREAAVKAGCPEPRIYMQSPDADGKFFIEVTCPPAKGGQ